MFAYQSFESNSRKVIDNSGLLQKFVVVRVFTTTPATFKLQDMIVEDIQVLFCEPELQRVTHEHDGIYRIEKNRSKWQTTCVGQMARITKWF